MKRDNSQKMGLLFGIMALFVILFVWMHRQPEQPATSGLRYYTGPMRSRWDPNVWVTADGKIVPPPQGAAPIAKPPAMNKEQQ